MLRLWGRSAACFAISFWEKSSNFLPKSMISPAIKGSCLAAAFSNVDLPQPFGPANVRISPLFTSKVISSNIFLLA